ncbi:1,6-anhydro-N-acetylmuramyl-L-alanine amidase AmpD [Craterilacuibacter sinensis]|uniref:1,6-anhydro-N-acetylmuramyl-L-alanine amidase AmpD n=1 Tax=Craterilacuibacter sinensis TaxID=2686017 RepID=A0A845BIM0_9NEIS|nr:1,6-anhydro-N-acetylmuramyl-L-alanine amidase AmpD [Craterilacuibacter sinensis]MXR36049.1 1,6-anhydro-N-acetylmuramyl-L-alanine amidase AmpD [Craterilacuibacter sinensis]
MHQDTALTLTADGWLEQARCLPSPNCNDYAPDTQPSLLVIHNISLPPNEYGGDGVVQLFTNTLDPAEHPYYTTIAHLRVSAHFFIRRDGELLQFVPVTRRAWHAGVSSFAGRECCNDFSIGVEMEGSDFEPFCEAQYATLNRLIARLSDTLPLVAITGHEHIAPGRKTDPGPCFEWDKVAGGLPLWKGL